MIVYPAVDLRGGQAVQLVGGRVEAQKVSLPDPVAVALQWVRAGFRALHVVDLDAALGTGDNRVVIAEILAACDVPVQVGGGIRDDAAVNDLIEAGAARVIVGTRAVEDEAWRSRITRRYPQRVIVAADVRGDYITTRGWTADTQIRAQDFISKLEEDPIAAALITDVSREGQLGGVDVAKFETLVTASSLAVIAAGGIRDMEDLRALSEVGVAGAVLGMSLYTGTIDGRAAAAEFSDTVQDIP